MQTLSPLHLWGAVRRGMAMALVAAAASLSSAQEAEVAESSLDRPQYESTHAPRPYPPVLIRGATVMTAAGDEIEGGAVAFADGRILGVGRSVAAPDGAVVVEAAGKFVTPGIIDTHSHLGVYAAPGTPAESDGNELPVS
ncbi:MAG: amidohydrolase, partial [Thermoanaerobaculia bacterium]|nr:amidohydrolase [Thermoanaerobaculia bacterium]